MRKVVKPFNEKKMLKHLKDIGEKETVDYIGKLKEIIEEKNDINKLIMKKHTNLQIKIEKHASKWMKCARCDGDEDEKCAIITELERQIELLKE